MAPEEADWTAWSSDPFALIQKPFGSYLEPEGYAEIANMKSPQTKSYDRLMPRTTRLARSIYAALPEINVWGKQIAERAEGWVTVTAGEKGRWDRQKAMSEYDVIKALACPNGRAIASQDGIGDRHSRVRHVRIDIDLDRTFDLDGRDHRAELIGEIAIVHNVFTAFGLSPQVFRTGNRGIQAIAPISPLHRAHAWVLTECICTVLKGHSGRAWRATDFMSSLDGIMRLPLGLHAWTRSLGLFLDRGGAVLSPEDQVEAARQAFWLRDDGLAERDLPFAPEPDEWDWTEEMRPKLGMLHIVPKIELADVVTAFPGNSLVQMFREACGRFGVQGWSELDTHTKVGFNKTVSEAGGNAAEDAEHEADRPRGSSDPPSYEHDTHTKVGFNKTSFGLNTSSAKLKGIGWAILSAGFEPGNSFAYYVNRMHGAVGKNAIGWAIVVHDGDREAAKAWLDSQAETVPGTPETIAQRKALIAWGIKRNDTYERFQHHHSLSDHRTFAAEITGEDNQAAARIVDALPALRAAASCRTKVFQARALDVIGHTITLMSAASRTSADGLVAVSVRTLAAEILARWPDCKVAHKDLARHMTWITKGTPDCLIEALEIVEKPNRVTDPTVYRVLAGLGEH